MSREKPEVGDVWVEKDLKHDYRRCVWISLVKDAMVSGITDEGRCLWCCPIEEFWKKYNFSSKSKFKLHDLFEVKDEDAD